MIVVSSFTNKINAQYQKGDVLDINGVKGIVFQVDESGSHGKIMSVKAFRGRKNLYCSKSSFLKDIPMDSTDDGYLNTKKLFEHVVDKNISIDEFPVYKWCASLGAGWYIPSIDELKEFINYWLGNEVEEVDWDNEDIEEEEIDDVSHKQKVNNVLLESGGVPFLNGVFTSTKSDKDKVHVYVYDRQKDYWEFVLLSPMKMDSYTVGRAFYKF